MILLKSAYLLLTIVITLVLIRIGWFAINKSMSNSQQANKAKTVLVLALLFWHSYLFFISESGILADFSLPPRMPILVIIPLFLFSGVFVYTNRKKTWVNSIPTHWLVYYQSLRIGIESIFYFSVGAGVLPALVTFEGYNYDILFGISALLIGYFTFTKQLISLKWIDVWNVFGLLVIAFIISLFLTGTYFPEIYEDPNQRLTPIYTQYPYILVAGFLMPSAVFIHFLSLAQQKKQILTK